MTYVVMVTVGACLIAVAVVSGVAVATIAVIT